jgi:hypothetical protein
MIAIISACRSRSLRSLISTIPYSTHQKPFFTTGSTHLFSLFVHYRAHDTSLLLAGPLRPRYILLRLLAPYPVSGGRPLRTFPLFLLPALLCQ